MQFLIAVVIAGIVTFFVVQDAKTLREEEIAAFGASSVSPGMWGTGVFLLMIAFLPAYVLTRMSHNKKLLASRPDAGQGFAPEPVVAVAASSLDEIAKAHGLLEKGAITQAEYETIKARTFRNEEV